MMGRIAWTASIYALPYLTLIWPGGVMFWPHLIFEGHFSSEFSFSFTFVWVKYLEFMIIAYFGNIQTIFDLWGHFTDLVWPLEVKQTFLLNLKQNFLANDGSDRMNRLLMPITPVFGLFLTFWGRFWPLMTFNQ